MAQGTIYLMLRGLGGDAVDSMTSGSSSVGSSSYTQAELCAQSYPVALLFTAEVSLMPHTLQLPSCASCARLHTTPTRRGWLTCPAGIPTTQARLAPGSMSPVTSSTWWLCESHFQSMGCGGGFTIKY